MPRAMQPPHGPSLPAPNAGHNVGSGTSPNTGAGVDLNRRFAEEMGAFLGPDFPSDIGLAVSGGGDSMAMLHLAAPWARVMGIRLWVATIDHGLRAESAAEAALVAQACTDLGLSHSTLKWDGWDGKGNLQASARAARHDLLGRWRGSVQHIAFGHTEDDQAETVLMRLTRGSGVEGLSGMSARQTISDTALPNLDSSAWTLLRPLLPTTRAELRHYLRVLHIPYVDDPTNDDLTYDRVKARKVLDILAPLGLTAQTLAQTATRMARARTALEHRAADAAKLCIRAAHYDVQLDRDAFAAIDRDTQLRLLARALQMVASNPYRPRAAPLEDLLDRALAGGDGVLHGGHVLARRGTLWVIREFNAIASVSQPAGPCTRWDTRILSCGPAIEGLIIRALGEDGIAQLPERPADIPRAALRVTPAAFDHDTLMGCFRLGYGVAYDEEHRPNPGMFEYKS
jgi:tRNA(Ile)-lysidine synthase